MAHDATEEEQIELIKKFLKQYGPSIVIGIFCAMVGHWGWNLWQEHKITRAQAASTAYEQMLTQFNSPDEKSEKVALVLAEAITTDYSDTPYAALSELISADLLARKKEYPEATEHLQKLGKSKLTSIRVLAKLRLAQLSIVQKQWQKALDQLEGVPADSALSAIGAMVKGEAYVGLKKYPEAREQFQLALKLLPKDSSIRALIKIIFLDVP